MVLPYAPASPSLNLLSISSLKNGLGGRHPRCTCHDRVTVCKATTCGHERKRISKDPRKLIRRAQPQTAGLGKDYNRTQQPPPQSLRLNFQFRQATLHKEPDIEHPVRPRHAHTNFSRPLSKPHPSYQATDIFSKPHVLNHTEYHSCA